MFLLEDLDFQFENGILPPDGPTQYIQHSTLRERMPNRHALAVNRSIHSRPQLGVPLALKETKKIQSET